MKRFGYIRGAENNKVTNEPTCKKCVKFKDFSRTS